MYLPTKSDVADASDRYEIEVKNCLAKLGVLGATDSMLATVERALVASDHSDGSALAMVATDEEVLLSYSMFRPVAELFVSLEHTPALLPLLEATQADVPHIAVLLDRVGADIWYRADLGAAIETTSVEGEDRNIHRSHPGGWSQRRFQQIAENSWEANAKRVVGELLDESPGVELVVAAGDVRAIGFFADHLPGYLGELITVDGSRTADHEAFLDNADVAVLSVAAERLVDALKESRNALGEGRAVEGRDVLELLGQGRIDHLLVVDDTLDESRGTAHFDFGIPAMTADDTGTDGPAADGAVALAVASGAAVTVAPKAALENAMVGIVRGSITAHTG